MNKDIFEGSWTELKGKVKQKWGQLTDENLTEINGNREKLSGAIQKSYGIAVEEAKKQMDEWEAAFDKAA